MAEARLTEAVDIGFVGAGRLATLHSEALPQKDEFCGPFCGALAVRAFGIDEIADEPVDQDLIARESGTTLSHGDPYLSLPAGEKPRVDYRLEVPAAADPATAGTSATALANAIERCSTGELQVVRVAGPWDGTHVVDLLECTLRLVPETVVIANLRTGTLWGSRPETQQLIAALAGEAPTPPAPDWDVGHFVSLAGLVRGPGGVLVAVRDTYPSLGWNGNYLQPPVALAAALVRGDGVQGGLLCVCRATGADVLRAQLAADGFELRDWDNGSVPAAGTMA